MLVLDNPIPSEDKFLCLANPLFQVRNDCRASGSFKTGSGKGEPLDSRKLNFVLLGAYFCTGNIPATRDPDGVEKLFSGKDEGSKVKMQTWLSLLDDNDGEGVVSFLNTNVFKDWAILFFCPVSTDGLNDGVAMMMPIKTVSLSKFKDYLRDLSVIQRVPMQQVVTTAEFEMSADERYSFLTFRRNLKLEETHKDNIKKLQGELAEETELGNALMAGMPDVFDQLRPVGTDPYANAMTRLDFCRPILHDLKIELQDEVAALAACGAPVQSTSALPEAAAAKAPALTAAPPEALPSSQVDWSNDGKNDVQFVEEDSIPF